MAVKISFAARITMGLNKLVDVCESHNPDTKHNTGRQYGLIYFWTMVEKYAEGQKDAAWKYAIENNMIQDPTGLDTGEYTLDDSPSFNVSVKVSEPVRRFSADALAEAIHKRFKISLPTAKDMIEKAKVPTKSMVTKSVTEQSNG